MTKKSRTPSFAIAAGLVLLLHLSLAAGAAASHVRNGQTTQQQQQQLQQQQQRRRRRRRRQQQRQQRQQIQQGQNRNISSSFVLQRIDNPDRRPYVASLRSDGEAVCEGSLIAAFAVLTSARCAGRFDSLVVGEDRYEDYNVSSSSLSSSSPGVGKREEDLWWLEKKGGGRRRLGGGGEAFASFRPVIHPGYDPDTLENDYMVVLLPAPVGGDVVPVELNQYDDVIPHELMLLSFGGEETPHEYVTNSECERYQDFVPSAGNPEILVRETYRGRIYDGMLCAVEEYNGAAGRNDECNLNSAGGPLVMWGSAGRDVLFGSVSWGRCDARGFPAVFSRVSEAVSWVEGVLCSSPLLLGGEATLPPSSPPCVRAPPAARKARAGTKNNRATVTRLRNSWPHFLTLEITFDDHPEQVSWKFENRRTSNVLAGVAFGEYPTETHAGRTVAVPLDVLTEEDYSDDWMGSQPGVPREYRFVIYDRGGDGLCCCYGNGKYTLSSKGTVVARGDSYGAIDEHFFSIDPRDYLGDDGQNGGALPVVNVPRPTPVSPGDSDNGEQSPQPTNQPITRKPTLPSLILSFFCGSTFDDAQRNCHLPCPTGSPSECERNGLDGHTCFASTTCRERWPTLDPTRVPTEEPNDPTKRPTPPPTSQPTQTPPPPTLRPTRGKPTPPPQAIPTTQIAIDSNTWFCGVDWDWITDHCDEAKPCPRGDPVDCPTNQACFASTPCTLSPTSSPTTDPTASPTEEPTRNPTRAPWSEASFVDFLYGQSNAGQGDGASSNNGGIGQVDDTGIDLELAIEALDESSLQWNFFCGISWTHADETCDVFCPSGDKSDCPGGTECYANTRCDGRDTPSPTASPAPSIPGGADNVAGSGEEICALCDGKLLDESKSVSFQTATMTCADVDQTIRMGKILVGSATCNDVREMYRSSCCYDECQLCQSPEGNFLDLRGKLVVRQGGYEASCQEISSILSASTMDNTICADARSQLGGECCYEQCTLCGDQSEMSTEWYAEVTFQGLATTCLGIDYMLRTEQISNGSNQCTELQRAYMDRCCYAGNSCQLCRTDDRLYKVDQSKTIVTESNFRSTFTKCTSIDESLSKLQKSEEECVRGKQTFFGLCCDLSNIIVPDNSMGSPGGPSNNAPPSKGVVAPQQQPSPEAGTPSNPFPGEAPNPAAPTPTSPGVPAPTAGMEGKTPPRSSSNPTSSNSPTSEGRAGTIKTNTPTQPSYWNAEPSGSDFSWENWDSPNGGYQALDFSLIKVFGTLTIFFFHV